MQEILTVKELAEYLRVSITTIYRKVSDQSIPCFKVNDGEKSSIRFTKENIDKWRKEQEDVKG